MYKKTLLYFITQSETGGAQRYVHDLINNFKNDYYIVVIFGEQGSKGKLAQMLEQEKILYHSIPSLKREISFFNDLKTISIMVNILNYFKPQIIHLNSSKISILGSMASLIYSFFNKKPYIIYTVHGWVFNEPLTPLKKNLYKYAEKFTALVKDKLICVSEFDRELAIKEKICREKKLITILNGIEPINFKTREESQIFLQSKIKNLQIGKGDIIIGTIGNLYKNKGLEYLIDATKLLIEKKLDVKLIIIGEGEERKALEERIAQFNLGKFIFLAGKIENASQILPGFDFYVSSSLKEGLSYSIIEAMMSGLPIIATRVGGTPELITDRAEGLLVDAKSSEQIANGIIKFIREDSLIKKLGTNAQAKIKDTFNLEKMIEKTKKVYTQDT